MVGASRLQLLGQVTIRDLFLIQLSPGKLQAVLRNLELRFQFFDLLLVIFLQPCNLFLVLLFSLRGFGLIAFFQNSDVLLVIILNLGKQSLMLVLDYNQRLVDLQLHLDRLSALLNQVDLLSVIVLCEGLVDGQLPRQLGAEAAVRERRELDLQVHQAAEFGLLADIHRQVAVAVLGLVDHERQIVGEALVQKGSETRGKVRIIEQETLSLAQVVEALLVEGGLENIAVKRHLENDRIVSFTPEQPDRVGSRDIGALVTVQWRPIDGKR